MEECTPYYVLYGPAVAPAPGGSFIASPPLLFLSASCFFLLVGTCFSVCFCTFCFSTRVHQVSHFSPPVCVLCPHAGTAVGRRSSGYRVAWALPLCWGVCLVTICPVTLQNTKLMGFIFPLHCTICVSVLALPQLCGAGPWGPSPCFIGLETLSRQTGQ